MQKRIKFTMSIISIVFVLLVCRLAYIQLYCGEELAVGARGQQAIPILQETGRSIIYDRNLIPLTNRTDGYYYLLPIGSNPPANLLSRICAVPAGRKGETYQVYKSQIYSPKTAEKLKKEYGAYVFSAGARYADHQVAAHLIGNLAEDGHLGVSGLEKMYQYRLSSPALHLSLLGDAAGTPVAGAGLSEWQKKRQISPSALVTTIDYALQRKVEEILKKGGITGAVIVNSAENGEILAMASAPSFNPNHTEDYFSAENSPLMNRAVSGLYPPGSVFKIITAAAALESGRVDAEHQYTCTGSITVNGVKMVCSSKPHGHGTLDMKKAFALSCNCYFVHAAEMTGGREIYEMAQRFGLSSRVFRNFPGEELGILPPESEYLDRGLANFAIGQGSLLLTPLAAAKMTGIIAAGGIDRGFALTLPSAPLGQGEKRVISAKTAETIGKMMEEVMTGGTGFDRWIKIKTAGKTGSAEGAFLGNEAVHGWFCGYFPAENPKYTVTIICENGKTGSGSALPVFEQIVNFLY